LTKQASPLPLPTRRDTASMTPAHALSADLAIKGGRHRLIGAGGKRAAASSGAGVGGGTRHPAEGAPVFRRGDALISRFQFVADHSERHGVKRLCQIVGVARSSFYHWQTTAEVRTTRADAVAVLAEQIRASWSGARLSRAAVMAEPGDPGRIANIQGMARAGRAQVCAGRGMSRASRLGCHGPEV